MLPSVRDVARGKWRSILVALGFDDKVLDGKHHPCPHCGGVDRFRFDDKGGNGTSYCSNCGASDGIGLLMKVKDCDFRAAALLVEQEAGFVKASSYPAARTDEAKVKSLRRLWKETRPVTHGDPVSLYLRGRGIHLSQYPQSLRYHPELPYRDGDQVIGKFPAMVALVTGPDGAGVTLHRTYLDGGRKAPVPSPKKLMPGLPLSGAAIRLSVACPCVGIAEGIETSLAASIQFSMPVWSCVSANGVESFIPPKGIEKVVVFGDQDESFTGQAAAYALAKRLVSGGIQVEVRFPEAGDWADVLMGVAA